MGPVAIPAHPPPVQPGQSGRFIMPRVLIDVLIFLAWLIFTAGVTWYQEHDSHRAGEHPETDADMEPGGPEEPPLECAA